MIRMRQVWVRNNTVWWENPKERKKHLEKPKSRRQDNIRMCDEEIGM
jgi:hypothetical protein